MNGVLVLFSGFFFLFLLAVIAVMIASVWKVFTKAGKPGWVAIVPIYNAVVLLEVAGRPLWWVVLLFIPVVSLVIWIIVAIDLAKSFGKSTGFALGLVFLGFIFFPILGFGPARYLGPAGAEGRPALSPVS
ncbi:MAG: signal peptidase I [Bryobacterales bacterium]|nr:signal peptidase I [Bryobacterales bacterium]